jgi:hypothetical protein
MKGVLPLANIIVSFFRTISILVLGLFVFVLAIVVLVAAIALVLGAVVWGLLTGRRTTARDHWGRFQQSTASALWRRYRRTTVGSGNTEESAKTVDVEDVAYRDVNPPPSSNSLKR